MATIQHKSHDKTVATIVERNNLNPRTPGMMVLVLDAIGDPYAGSGRAVYRWDEVQASWILMFKDNVETLTFTGESKSISQDRIQLSNIPANGQVWDVIVRDGMVVHQVEHSVAGSVVTIQPDTPGQFDGKQLSVRYAYGTMTQQLDLEIARVVGEAVGAFDKEAVGLGNVDNTSDATKPISTATQQALDDKEASGTAATAMSAHTSAADPHGQYLPKAGGTMSGPINFAPAQTWPTFNQSTTGNAATATKLAAARSIDLAGAVTGKASFNGTQDVSIVTTIPTASAVSYTYDAAGRVSTTTETLPTGTRTTTVTYNEAGQVKTVAVTLGTSTRTVQYAYDQYGVLTGTTSTES